MSKKIDNLLPEDFEKSVDKTVFPSWKESVIKHEKASQITVILEGLGLAALWFLGGIGLVLCLALMITGLAIALPAWNKRRHWQRKLGVTSKDVENAIEDSKKRINKDK
jgi:hypothetical protein